MADFLKISAPHTVMTTYQMSLISAESISLDITFKIKEIFKQTLRILRGNFLLVNPNKLFKSLYSNVQWYTSPVHFTLLAYLCHIWIVQKFCLHWLVFYRLRLFFFVLFSRVINTYINTVSICSLLPLFCWQEGIAILWPGNFTRPAWCISQLQCFLFLFFCVFLKQKTPLFIGLLHLLRP
jgi:hypothetical protein